jgi:hypothetical protein
MKSTGGAIELSTLQAVSVWRRVSGDGKSQKIKGTAKDITQTEFGLSASPRAKVNRDLHDRQLAARKLYDAAQKEPVAVVLNRLDQTVWNACKARSTKGRRILGDRKAK